jgi:DNA-binding CsgD family transcriptional regulator
MGRLSERDYLDILEVVGLVATATDTDRLPPDVLRAMQRLFPNARTLAVCEGPMGDRRARRIWTLAPPVGSDIREAMDAFRHQNPLSPTVGSMGTPRLLSDVIDRRSYHRLDLYTHVGRVLEIEYSLELWLRPPGRPLLGWLLDASDRDFSDRDRDVLDLLGHHVAPILAAARRRRATPRGAQLTDRQAAILTLVAEGRGNDEIAALLDISTHTVRTHLEHAFLRLGVQTRAAAVAAAFT